MRLDRERAVLVVVDAQERLFPHIDGHPALEREIDRLVTGCRTLSLPIIVTEQYTKGLGTTIASIREALGSDYEPIEKATFSCAGHEPFVNVLNELGRQQVVLCGIEAHVCVYQTAIDLIDRGHFVYLVTDAVGSRRASNAALAIRRIEQAGGTSTSVEMALFELLAVSGTDEFRAVSKLVK